MVCDWIYVRCMPKVFSDGRARDWQCFDVLLPVARDNGDAMGRVASSAS